MMNYKVMVFDEACWDDEIVMMGTLAECLAFVKEEDIEEGGDWYICSDETGEVVWG